MESRNFLSMFFTQLPLQITVEVKAAGNKLKIEHKEKKMLATPAVRMKSPINLLNRPESAYLR
jgi:hypothetical protein